MQRLLRRDTVQRHPIVRILISSKRTLEACRNHITGIHVASPVFDLPAHRSQEPTFDGFHTFDNKSCRHQIYTKGQLGKSCIVEVSRVRLIAEHANRHTVLMIEPWMAPHHIDDAFHIARLNHQPTAESQIVRPSQKRSQCGRPGNMFQHVVSKNLLEVLAWNAAVIRQRNEDIRFARRIDIDVDVAFSLIVATADI